MKKFLPLMIVLLATAAGCGGPGHKGTAKDAAGRELEVVAPSGVLKIAQGEQKEFPVTVHRTKFEGPVELSFDNLPKGVTVEGDKKIPKDKSDAILTLKADKDAERKTDASVKITATAPDVGLQKTVAFKVTIDESLKNREARRQVVVNRERDRFKEVEKYLKDVEGRANDAKPEFKTKFLKKLARLNEDLKTAKKRLEDLESAQLTTWEQYQRPAESAIANLESAVQQADSELKQHLTGKSK